VGGGGTEGARQRREQSNVAARKPYSHNWFTSGGSVLSPCGPMVINKTASRTPGECRGDLPSAGVQGVSPWPPVTFLGRVGGKNNADVAAITPTSHDPHNAPHQRGCGTDLRGSLQQAVPADHARVTCSAKDAPRGPPGRAPPGTPRLPGSRLSARRRLSVRCPSRLCGGRGRAPGACRGCRR
jgi:hypothetical protein